MVGQRHFLPCDIYGMWVFENEAFFALHIFWTFPETLLQDKDTIQILEKQAIGKEGKQSLNEI